MRKHFHLRQWDNKDIKDRISETLNEVGERKMIYTCTMNTAIDLYVQLEKLMPDKVNRTIDEDYQPNGKGVNVSIMLKRYGIESVATGFIAGFTGEFIQDSLQKLNIKTDFVHVDGITRINVFMNADKEYKVVNQGPSISKEKQRLLIEKIGQMEAGSTLIVSGSLPVGVSEAVLAEIGAMCKMNGVHYVLDTSISSLDGVLASQPYLLKPNEEELAGFFQVKHRLSEKELVYYGYELIKRGAKQVLISRGKDGSIYLNKDTCLFATSPKGKVLNTACAGDALLATFIGHIQQGTPVEDALAKATATGASTAFSKGLSDLKDVPMLLDQVQITRRGFTWQK